MNPKSTLNLRLQSVRALAALTVVAFHVLIRLSFPESESYRLRAVLNVFNGLDAVCLFFILSGFVLGITLIKRKPYNLSECWGFIRHRFMRLFPAIVFSSLLYAIYYRYFYEPRDFPVASGWFNMPHPVSLLDLTANIFLIRYTLDGATWSLQVEWLFSLLLPVLYFWTSRSPRSNFIILAVLLFLYYFPAPAAWKWNATRVPWYFLFMCYAGWMLAIYKDHLLKWLHRLPRFLLYVLILFCFGVCATNPHFGHHLELFTAAATFLIGVIVLNVTPGFFRFLDAKPLISIGNISYSFYLLHTLVLTICEQALLSHVSNSWIALHLWFFAFVLFLVTVAITIPLSCFSFWLCERPFLSPRQARSADLTPSPVFASRVPHA